VTNRKRERAMQKQVRVASASGECKGEGRGVDLTALSLDVARGVGAVCDAITYLGRAAKVTCNPQLEPVRKHLVLAAAGIPDELWAMMFAADHVGFEEVAARLQVTVSESGVAA